jgi:hypothetical protein
MTKIATPALSSRFEPHLLKAFVEVFAHSNCSDEDFFVRFIHLICNTILDIIHLDVKRAKATELTIQLLTKKRTVFESERFLHNVFLHLRWKFSDHLVSSCSNEDGIWHG